ncbi:MAG: response regulator transcription factor [Olsenella profusa]
MTRVLIVEDEERIARFLELELSHEGYEVTKLADGRAAVEAALAQDFDLILLDVMLPGLNGLEVLRRIRRTRDTPTIMLTARDAVMDKVAGLDAGADDYVTKPFAIEELLARIRVALKRHEPTGPAAGTTGAEAGAHLASGGVCLDLEAHELTVRGREVELTNSEFEVLRVLLEHAGVVMARERIASEALGYELMGETNNVDVHVAHLRRKIDGMLGRQLISTVRGVGYVIREG